MHLFYTRLLIYSTPVWRPADLGSYHHSPLLVSGVLATSACTLSALLVALGPVIRIPPQFQDPPRLEPSSARWNPPVTQLGAPVAITLASAAITPMESLPRRARDRADRLTALTSHASRHLAPHRFSTPGPSSRWPGLSRGLHVSRCQPRRPAVSTRGVRRRHLRERYPRSETIDAQQARSARQAFKQEHCYIRSHWFCS